MDESISISQADGSAAPPPGGGGGGGGALVKTRTFKLSIIPKKFSSRIYCLKI